MDRNFSAESHDRPALVATREGGVDRNVDDLVFDGETNLSPPARVAWIETERTEIAGYPDARSPPARVAWIETFLS